VVGALAAVASPRCSRPSPGATSATARAYGRLWFGVATATDLFIGRLTFGLGVAFALAALLPLQRGPLAPRWRSPWARRWPARSPGLFLAMACGTLWLTHRDRTDGLWVAAGAFVPGGGGGEVGEEENGGGGVKGDIRKG
jgi:hypothetical protein